MNTLFINNQFFKDVADNAVSIQNHNGFNANDLHMLKVRFYEDNRDDIWYACSISCAIEKPYTESQHWFLKDQILEEDFEDDVVTAVLENIKDYIDTIDYTRQEEVFKKCQNLILAMNREVSYYYNVEEGEPYEE